MATSGGERKQDRAQFHNSPVSLPGCPLTANLTKVARCIINQKVNSYSTSKDWSSCTCVSDIVTD